MATTTYASPVTTFDELVRRLGVNFRASVIYWDDEPPERRKDPWHIVVTWIGAPGPVIDKWKAASRALPPSVIPNRQIVVAEVFGATLDVSAMAAYAELSLRIALDTPEQIVAWRYDDNVERLVPQTGDPS